MEREARWQLVRRALDSQSHEVKEHTEEQDECIAPEAMGPHEARMGRVVFGSTGSMQHHPDVGASEKHEKRDRKSTRLNSSHGSISYAVFCLKKKRKRRRAEDGL